MILEDLCTERLRFRPVENKDRTCLLAYFNDNLATQFLFLDADIATYTDNWIHRQQKRYENGGGGMHSIELKTTGELIGQCGLVRQFVDGIPKWEVGYHLFRKYWGNGYATEAAMACRNFCFQNEMAETLISLIHPENEKSKAVAKRNGLTFWKETTHKGVPVVVYKIIRPDWEKVFPI